MALVRKRKTKRTKKTTEFDLLLLQIPVTSIQAKRFGAEPFYCDGAYGGEWNKTNRLIRRERVKFKFETDRSISSGITIKQWQDIKRALRELTVKCVVI